MASVRQNNAHHQRQAVRTRALPRHGWNHDVMLRALLLVRDVREEEQQAAPRARVRLGDRVHPSATLASRLPLIPPFAPVVEEAGAKGVVRTHGNWKIITAHMKAKTKKEAGINFRKKRDGGDRQCGRGWRRARQTAVWWPQAMKRLTKFT